MTDEPFRRDRLGRSELSPVEAIMTGLLGLAVAVTLGYAVGGLLGALSP
jgi:hypothetical protein